MQKQRYLQKACKITQANLLGIDIGCGMTCVKVQGKRMQCQKLDTVIRERIPAGFAIRTRMHHLAKQFEIERLHCCDSVHMEKVFLSLGTLGGGNHFPYAYRPAEQILGQIGETVEITAHSQINSLIVSDNFQKGIKVDKIRHWL